MKKLSSKFHGFVDYTTILFLCVSPLIFHFKSPAEIFTYSLALVHLLLTVCTDFEMGIFKLIPLKVHGTIELVVSIALIPIANLFQVANDMTSFYYYVIFAGILFIVWWTSSYSLARVKIKKEW